MTKERNTIKKILLIKREYGLLNYLLGRIKRVYYRRLRNKFSFGEWHLEPYELRPYAFDIKNYVNKLGNKELCVCEIGCGLGDIIRNIHAKRRIGVDISKEAINCARYLSRWGGLEYYVGSFDDVGEIVGEEHIDVLITVNFIHNIEPSVLRSYYESIFSKKKVRYVILDTIDSKGYLYFHDVGYLFPELKASTVISSHIVSTGGERRVYLVDTGNL